MTGSDPFRRYADRFGRPLESVRDRLRRADPPGVAERARTVAGETGVPTAAVLGPATYFADLAGRHGRRHVRVCGATACFAATAGRHVAEVGAALGVAPGGCTRDGAVSLQEVRCLGYCYAGPAALDGEQPCAGADLTGQLLGRRPRQEPPVPVACTSPVPIVTAGLVGGEEPWSVWPQVVARGTPADVLAAVGLAGLRGRGGAGFPTARKWAEAAAAAPPRVVVANGDEGDPGSYVDRLLMEGDPHRLLEGLALACFAVGAEEAVVFVRSEYPRARDRLRAAVDEASAAGHLGRRVHGSPVDVRVRVAEGAGSYVSGEETALLNGLEGLRGVVRPRPPYPTEHGWLGRPTVVNNVETLAAVPWIVRHGGAAYARFGTRGETGTTVVCLSERFARPGAYEVELGASLRHTVEQLGGGLRDGAALRAVQVGGPLGGFLGLGDLDVPLSEAGLSARGAALGHAGIVAFDDRVGGEDLMRHLWRFAEAESCGQCSPCRVGSRRGLALADGSRDDEAVRAARAELLRTMRVASLCAFGRRVPAAVRSLARVYELAGWSA